MYGHTKGFLILGQLLSYTGPGNNTCPKKKNFSWAPCLFLAKPRQKISLTSASHIYHRELRNHTAKKSSALVQAPQSQVFFASFSSAASFAFLSFSKAKSTGQLRRTSTAGGGSKASRATPHLQLQVVLFKLFWRSIILKFRKIISLD